MANNSDNNNSDKFLIISLNVNHNKNLGGLLSIIRTKNPTVICLQEVSQDTQELNKLVSRLGYTGISNLGIDRKPGVAILHLKTLPVIEIRNLDQGRLQLLHTQGGHKIMNMYAPSGNSRKEERRQFFNGPVLRNIRLTEVRPVIVGDFNCVIDPQDCEENYNRKKCEPLKELVDLFSYSDIWRTLHPNSSEFTFFRASCTPARLDRIYCPPLLLTEVLDSYHFPTLSDHAAVALVIKFQLPARGSRVRAPYWKLNAAVLNEPYFDDSFLEFWAGIESEQENFENISEWWENFAKPQCKRFCQNLSKIRAYERNGTQAALWVRLDQCLHSGNFEQAALLRTRLNSMMTQDLQGFIIRSRHNEFAEEERGSLFHAAREVKRAQETNISSLNINGNVVEDQEMIAEEVLSFYGALYNGQHRTVEGEDEPINTGQVFTPSDEFIGEFLENLQQLTGDEKSSLEQNLTLEELGKALDSCTPNKSPGLDGLSYEFYRKVKSVIGPTLLKVFQEQLNSGNFTPSFRSGATKLIPKVNGVPSIQQIRPITLLSCDYKILSKILCARINVVLPTVLGSQQLSGNPSNSILNGAVNMLSTIEYVNMKQLEAYMVSFDIFKAFDKTSVEFICKVLLKMNFPDIFINQIKALHKDISTQFIINGKLSKSLILLVSLRQGDPLALCLYLINQEPLLNYINRKVKGVTMASLTQKEEGYVDDISVLSTDLNDLEHLNQAFLKFESMSGTVLNRSHKSKIMGLGRWKDKEDWPLLWLRTEPSLKVFGIQFTPTTKGTIHQSWEKCIQGVRNCIMAWSNRMLPTLNQRIQVVQTFALSKIWYLAQVLPIPKKHLLEVEKTVRRFLWLGRLEHLPFDELYGPIKEGGLNLVNIGAKCDSLYLKQTLRMLNSETNSKKHLSYWIGIQMRRDLPELANGPHAEIIPPYFKHTVNLLKEAVNADIVNLGNMGAVKSKAIYADLNSTPPPPKITIKHPELPWELIYDRLDSSVLSPACRDLWFIVINNIYPNKQRLHRLNQHESGNCAKCANTPETNPHLFMECVNTRPVWLFVRELITDKQPGLLFTPCINFMSLSYTRLEGENMTLFLLSTYVAFIHECRRSDENVNVIKFKGYLKSCYFKYIHGKHPDIGVLNF